MPNHTGASMKIGSLDTFEFVRVQCLRLGDPVSAVPLPFLMLVQPRMFETEGVRIASTFQGRDHCP